MADLLGGINQFALPHSNITLEFGFERLYHINGEFREDSVLSTAPECDQQRSSTCDAELREALSYQATSAAESKLEACLDIASEEAASIAVRAEHSAEGL